MVYVSVPLARNKLVSLLRRLQRELRCKVPLRSRYRSSCLHQHLPGIEATEGLSRLDSYEFLRLLSASPTRGGAVEGINPVARVVYDSHFRTGEDFSSHQYGATTEIRTQVTSLPKMYSSHLNYGGVVPRGRIELPQPACKASVLPLNYRGIDWMHSWFLYAKK